MQLLNVVAIMAITFSPPVMTAKPTATKCVPQSKILSSVPGKFSLAVLAPDSKGRIDLMASRPVVLEIYDIFSARYVDVPRINQLDSTFFTLKNKTLSVGDLEASFLPEEYEIADFRGLQSFIFNPDLYFDVKPARFTATGACDSYGRSFLRLGGPDGEFVT